MKRALITAAKLIVALGLCILTLLAYSNSFSAGFALDNRGLLLEDPRIREASPEHLQQIVQHTYWWPYGESGLYRPVTTLSYLFNYAVLGNRDRPAGYHAVNLLLHVINVLLAYADRIADVAIPAQAATGTSLRWGRPTSWPRMKSRMRG